MGPTVRHGDRATRCALAVLLAAVLALLTGAGTVDSLHRLALDRCVTVQDPAGPAVPFDADGCPEPAERRRDDGVTPGAASTHRIGHSRAPLAGALLPAPRPPAALAAGAPPGRAAAGPTTEPARSDAAGRGTVLRC
ncbi:hypothetical protein [Kitasatospora sp. NPDC059327]|uniref:hypothetical protein n=1 Tax=Kitasatospora sp. NPDC059327 TaxID=3346803 RepID=UPI00369E38C2